MNNNYDPFKDPLLLPHEADGIKELDNKLPAWWVWLFYLCVAFAVFYMTYYHVLKAEEFRKQGGIQLSEYQAEMQIGDAIKAAAVAKFEASLPTLQVSKDEVMLAQGKQVYTTYCLPCHREDGGGLVGPNLCDDYWIHGSNYVDNLRIIVNGVPDKGMLTWRGVLKPAEIQAVASYIYTFRGTKPTNPKPPENQVSTNTGPSAFE